MSRGRDPTTREWCGGRPRTRESCDPRVALRSKRLRQQDAARVVDTTKFGSAAGMVQDAATSETRRMLLDPWMEQVAPRHDDQRIFVSVGLLCVCIEIGE